MSIVFLTSAHTLINKGSLHSLHKHNISVLICWGSLLHYDVLVEAPYCTKNHSNNLPTTKDNNQHCYFFSLPLFLFPITPIPFTPHACYQTWQWHYGCCSDSKHSYWVRGGRKIFFPRWRLAADAGRAEGGADAEACGYDYGWKQEVGENERVAAVGGICSLSAAPEKGGEIVFKLGNKDFHCLLLVYRKLGSSSQGDNFIFFCSYFELSHLQTIRGGSTWKCISWTHQIHTNFSMKNVILTIILG